MTLHQGLQNASRDLTSTHTASPPCQTGHGTNDRRVYAHEVCTPSEEIVDSSYMRVRQNGEPFAEP